MVSTSESTLVMGITWVMTRLVEVIRTKSSGTENLKPT